MMLIFAIVVMKIISGVINYYLVVLLLILIIHVAMESNRPADIISVPERCMVIQAT